MCHTISSIGGFSQFRTRNPKSTTYNQTSTLASCVSTKETAMVKYVLVAWLWWVVRKEVASALGHRGFPWGIWIQGPLGVTATRTRLILGLTMRKLAVRHMKRPGLKQKDFEKIVRDMWCKKRAFFSSICCKVSNNPEIVMDSPIGDCKKNICQQHQLMLCKRTSSFKWISCCALSAVFFEKQVNGKLPNSKVKWSYSELPMFSSLFP